MGMYHEKADLVREPLLPYDVRYALQYREAVMCKSEILDLSRNGFEREALYLFLKAAVKDPLAQWRAIQDLVQRVNTVNGLPERRNLLRPEIRAFVEKRINDLIEPWHVHGMKLAQLSRQGFTNWHERYGAAAERQSLSPQPTFLVGHSTFIGLPAFIGSHARAKKPLHLLIPSFIAGDKYAMCGYRIHETQVEFFPKDFERERDSVLVDDMRNSGKTMQMMRDFWHEDSRAPRARFEFVAES